jgi:hypothetical protein
MLEYLPMENITLDYTTIYDSGTGTVRFGTPGRTNYIINDKTTFFGKLVRRAREIGKMSITPHDIFNVAVAFAYVLIR